MLFNTYNMKKFICGTVLALLALTTQAQVDRSKAPLPGPAPKITLGKYETFTLKNGLKVIVVENHKVPKVTYNLVVDADPTLEGNKAGLVSIFGQMMGRGTTTKTKAQIDEQTDIIGASLYPSSNGVYGSVMKKNNEKLLALMADVIINPVFNQDEFDKVMKNEKDNLESNKTDANAIVGNLIARTVYGKNHPYGDVETDSTVANITLADMKDFYSKNVMPNISYLAIVGDVSKSEIQPLVEKYFGGWVKGTPVKNKLVNPTPPANPEIVMSDRPGSKQSTLRFVYPVQNTVGGADYLKLRLLNSVLGGGATGRLFMNLREKHGYTYGAYSSISADENVGQFTASAEVRTEVTDSAIYQFITEFNKVSTSGVTPEELQLAKNELTGSFAIGLEDPQTVARFAINIDQYKLPKDYYDNYLTNLNAITVEDVNIAATKYVLPFNYYIVIVGDRSAIEKKILKYDTDKKITFLDPQGYKAAELKSAPAGTTAETVIDNYLKAVGGRDAIAKITDVTSTGKISSQFGALEFKQILKGGKSFQQLTITGMGSQTSVFDGKAGKSEGLMGASSLDAKEVLDAKADASPVFEADIAKNGVTVSLLGIDVIDGTDAYKMEITMPSGSKLFAWYNVKTSLKIKESRMEESEQGSMEIITKYGSYQAVNGVMFPYSINSNALGGELIIEKMEINTGVKDEIFTVK